MLLNMRQIAERVGLAYATIQQYRWLGKLPAPDAWRKNRPVWLEDTIDQWDQNRARVGDRWRR